MATTERIRISTEVLEDIQEKLELLNSELQSNCSAVRLWADRIERQSGADVMISTGSKMIGTGNAKALLKKCDKALRLCEQESQRLSKAIGSGSTMFADNEKRLVSRFNNESLGEVSGYQGTGNGGNGGAGVENAVSEEENPNFVSDMMKFVERLLSMGDQGQQILEAIFALVRGFGDGNMAAKVIAMSNSSWDQIMKSSALESLFGDMKGLAIASLVMKIASGVVTDIENGVAPDRMACNAIGNLITATLTTVGGAALGDLGATLILGAIGAVCPPAVPALSWVVYPLCNLAATAGLEAAMNLEIFGKPVSEHINDAVYAAYNGIKDGLEYTKEVFNTLGDMAQTGAEMIQQGVESAIDAGKEFVNNAIDHGKEFVNNVIDNGKEFVDNAIDNGKEFVNNAIDKGKEAVEDFGESIYDGITGFIDGGLSLLGA